MSNQKPPHLGVKPIPPFATFEQPLAADPMESSAPASQNQAHPATRKPPLPALTGLRSLLAITIMLFHFTPPHPDFLSPLLNNAYVFVGFFFLISGFVLAYNYADRPVLDRRKFYVARISRVYPVYALVLVLSTPFLFLEWQAHTHADFLLGLLLTPLALQGWLPTLATYWNTVAWTVPAEFFLYLIFPSLLLLLAARKHLIATPARLIAAITVVWLVGLMPHTLYLILNPDHLPGPATRYTYAYWLRALKYAPPAYICTFTAGVLIARLHAILTLSPRQRATLALVALAALTLFFVFAVDRLPYVLIHGCLLLPLFAMLLLGLAGQNPVASVFAWKPFVKVGETTFSLYLVHFNSFLLIHFYKLPERLHVTRLDPWISYLAIIALAFAVQRLYESPARIWILQKLTPAKSLSSPTHP